jgi:long-chain acyl-CoA synthetase
MIDVRPPTVVQVMSHHARLTPEKVAAVCGAEQRTWAQLVDRSNQIANRLLALGLQRGDKVAALLNNSIELLEVLLGTIAAGCVTVPLSVLMARDSLAAMIDNSEARVLFASADTMEQIMPLRGSLKGLSPDHGFISVDTVTPGWISLAQWLAGSATSDPRLRIDFDDSISILYTSGTTGVPKGMEHSHFSRLLYPLGLGPLMKIDAESRTILATPMYHNGTWVTMLPTLCAGGTVVILPKFGAAQFQEAVDRERCTHAFMVPSQLVLTLDPATFTADKLRTMRGIMCSGSPLSSETFRRIRENLPNLEFCEIYGMGEGFMTFIGTHDYAAGKEGSVGRPIAAVDTDIRIIGPDDSELAQGGVGEIVGYSALLLKGYYRDPERTAASLWTHPENGLQYLRSGDVGFYDADGYLHLSGRLKDMIISGGVKIYAIDIEDAFMQHPEVQEVAVIGIPHEKWGETPMLLAVMRPGARTSEEHLLEWGNARVGKTQRVSLVEFRTSFPRNTLDKILKRELREPYWAGMSRPIS